MHPATTLSMSQSREVDEDTDMAISYTQPSAGHQALPSFREVRYKGPGIPDHSLMPISSSPLTFTMKLNQPHNIIPHHAHKTAQGRATKWPTPALSHMAHQPRFHTTHIANTQSPANEWTPATPCGYPRAPTAAPVRSSHPSATSTPCRVAQEIKRAMSAPPDQTLLLRKIIASPGRPQWLRCPIAAVRSSSPRSCIPNHPMVIRWGTMSRSRLK